MAHPPSFRSSEPGLPTTTFGRFVTALLVGALAGGIVVAGIALYGSVSGHRFEEGLSYTPGYFILGSVVWLIGLLLVGGPVLGLLYAAKIRSRVAAATAGALLAFGGMMLLLKLMYPHLSSAGDAEQAVPIALAGAFVGWLIASLAYRRGTAAP